MQVTPVFSLGGHPELLVSGLRGYGHPEARHGLGLTWSPTPKVHPGAGQWGRAHHAEDGIDNDIDGHGGRCPPVLTEPHALLVVGQQVI